MRTALALAGITLADNSAAVRGSARDRYAVYSSETDREGRGVVRYTRTYDGLRVYGGDRRRQGLGGRHRHTGAVRRRQQRHRPAGSTPARSRWTPRSPARRTA